MSIQGQKVYYHKIVVDKTPESPKHIFTVKCFVTEVSLIDSPQVTRNLPEHLKLNHTASRRSVLPAGFQEAE